MQIIDTVELPNAPQYDIIRANQPDKVVWGQHAHGSLWWKNTPKTDKPNGFIGHFYAKNAASAAQLLKVSEAFLKGQGCQELIGPCDGNTWNPYRFVSWSDDSAAFILEPQNPVEWPSYWEDFGFVAYHEYISTLNRSLEQTDPRLPQAYARLMQNGIRWRCFSRSSFENDLRKVYQLSIEAFRQNVLYSPIDEDHFLSLYLPYADKLDLDFVLMAEDEYEQCCGFIFAIPDYLQLQGREKLNRLVIKTLAVHSSRRCAGLGSILVEEVQKRAFAKGFSESIHALMHCKNTSANIGKFSHTIRRYTLYRKSIA